MNIVFWSIIFFFVGAFWQIIDSILGVKVFRIWYNLTHKEPLMPEIRRGFITKRGSKANAFWAFIGSLVLCLLFVFQGDAGSLTKMMLWLLGIPVIMIGFYFGGPGLKKMWKKRDIFFEKIDEFESGDAVAKNQFRKILLKARDYFSQQLGSLAGMYKKFFAKKPKTAEEASKLSSEDVKTSIGEVQVTTSPPPAISVEATIQAQRVEDPREVIRRYTKGHEE